LTAKRTIAVFTGNRAEYGLQFPILRAIARHPALSYRLLVSGAHLDRNFGATLDEIRKDGFEIHDEIQIDVDGDTLYATAKAIGSGILSVSQSLDRLRPDLVVVYADRFEGFAAVIAASQMGIPTAHVEGGDITQGGALDDSVRHAMTKLAHLHFTTNEQAANRIRVMGEEPWRVFNVGFPAIDLIADGLYATPTELHDRFGLDPERPVVVFTQHSVSTRFEQAADQVKPSLAALERVAADGAQIVITYPNNDAGGRRIIEEIERLRARVIPNVQVHKSVGRYNYHGMLSLAGRGGRGGRGGGACVGNSSSGIKETPAFGCPTVDIGARQTGRLAANNVIATGYDTEEIARAIDRCLHDAKFIEQCRTCVNPYGIGDAGRKIADVLATVALDERLITKQMTIL
jgi:UDP-N-acetylglucosamine 2-epimerase (non-hydrolysing)/GDP/UDP-N,N'-diacetylbacillosamine 2-epimerase (hydrolysing)